MSIHDFDELKQFDNKNLNWFVVNWCMGNTCNYTCSYCPVSLHDGSKRWPAFKNVKTFIENVRRIHVDKKLHFDFTGGEITLNKDFIKICKLCKDNDISVGFISNGSRTIRWWQENKKYFDHVNLSFHAEHADQEHFCSVVKEVHLDVSTHVNVMMHPEHWDACLMLASRVKEIGNASIALQPLIHELANELYDYSHEETYILDHQSDIFGNVKWTKRFETYRGDMRAIKDGNSYRVSPHNFIAKGTNNWEGWNCWAGVEQIIVDLDGSIWRGWCKVGGPIGHIDDQDLALPSSPVICNKNRCHCNFDIMSSKSRL